MIGLGAAAAFLALTVPAEAATTGRLSGIVVGKHSQRLVLTIGNGSAFTVRAAAGHVKLGDRLSLHAVRRSDGTMRGTKLHVVGHVRAAKIRGVVVRDLRAATLVAAGHSVIRIAHRPLRALASAADDHELRPGVVGEFRVRIYDDDLFEEAPVLVLGQIATVRIEGNVVSVSPFVVSVEGLPLTITVPTGMTLPSGLAAGSRIELTVSATVGANNVFTLVAIDEIENQNVNNVVVPQEVEVTATVVSSTPTQIAVASGGTTFTFNAPAGTTLPTLPVGTSVEARGFSQNGVLTLERLQVEDRDDDGGGSGSGGGGSGDGGHDGGGHDGGGHGGGGHGGH
jgi:hypothetical protein